MTAVAAMTFAGCTKVDDTLGSNLVPDNQQMKAGYETFGALTLKGDLNPRRYVETRLYQTDSLITSNLTYGYMGSMLSDTFGLRTAGFLTQYVPYEIDSGYFGFRPILDSAIILLSISSYGSDTAHLAGVQRIRGRQQQIPDRETRRKRKVRARHDLATSISTPSRRDVDATTCSSRSPSPTERRRVPPPRTPP